MNIGHFAAIKFGCFSSFLNLKGNWNQIFESFYDFQIIDEEILCVHGGLSPDIRTIDQVMKALVTLSNSKKSLQI